MSSLIGRIEKLAKVQIVAGKTATAYWSPMRDEKFSYINAALAAVGEPERPNLAIELIRLWERREEREFREEARKLFSSAYDHFRGSNTLATLTADGKEFRVWYGVPASLKKSHAESAGSEGRLFEARGDSEAVARYRDAYQERIPGSEWWQPGEVKFPNGCKLYLGYTTSL